MGSMNSTEVEKGHILNRIRGNLLLALKYSRGENSNFIRVERYIRGSLNELEDLEL